MVSMTVFMFEIFVSVSHVLTCIDFVVFAFAIMDFIRVFSTVSLVLAKISANKGTISLGVVCIEKCLETVCNTEETCNSPSYC